jgi:hypothetical protein
MMLILHLLTQTRHDDQSWMILVEGGRTGLAAGDIVFVSL